MSDTRKTLTVVLADTWFPHLSAPLFEYEHAPYVRRTVQITLTPEQQEAIRPRKVGRGGGVEKYETVLDCWLEPPTTAEGGE